MHFLFPTAPLPGPHNLSEKSDAAQSVHLAITDMEINSPRHFTGVSITLVVSISSFNTTLE